MSAFASPRPLLLGIGNPLRGDDGLGWAVADQLAQDDELIGDMRTVHLVRISVARCPRARSVIL